MSIMYIRNLRDIFAHPVHTHIPTGRIFIYIDIVIIIVIVREDRTIIVSTIRGAHLSPGVQGPIPGIFISAAIHGTCCYLRVQNVLYTNIYIQNI